MRRDRATRLMDALEDLLDAERQIILNGDLQAVGRLAQQKERLLDNPALAATTPEGLERIRTKASRNGVLLRAAMAGVRAAAARLEALRKGPGALNTYDRDGQRTLLGQGQVTGALERKA